MPQTRFSGTPVDERRSPYQQLSERERRRIEDQLRLANEVAGLSANALDALTAMLIIEVILLPLFFLAGTDVYSMVLYAMAITGVCFALFFAVNVLAERSARGQKARLERMGEATPLISIIRPGRP